VSTPDPIFVTPQQAADMLAIPRSAVYPLLDSGEIDSRYMGRSRKVYVASLRKYAANLPAEPEAS
jgi:excisionase family DNA binding protein